MQARPELVPGTPLMPALPPDRLLAARLSAQLLAGPPAADPTAVAERLLAVQAQDPRGVRLAVRARTRGLTVADVDRALSEERSLLISWLNRGTLHLVRSEDYFWLHALTTPQLRAANERRLRQEGVSPGDADRGVALVVRALEREGPLARGELREVLEAAGIPTAGQAFVHVMMLASLRGLVVRGPVKEGDHCLVLTSDWVGTGPRAIDRDRALAEVARRYLGGHGPAGERDLARWAGIPLRDARAGLNAIAGQLAHLAGGLVDLTRRAPVHDLPPPKLLGAFDPAAVGWRSREFLLADHEPAIVSGGLFRPFALLRGRAAATWKLAEGHVVLEPLKRISRADRQALDTEGRDVERYLAAG